MNAKEFLDAKGFSKKDQPYINAQSENGDKFNLNDLLHEYDQVQQGIRGTGNRVAGNVNVENPNLNKDGSVNQGEAQMPNIDTIETKNPE